MTLVSRDVLRQAIGESLNSTYGERGMPTEPKLIKVLDSCMKVVDLYVAGIIIGLNESMVLDLTEEGRKLASEREPGRPGCGP